MTQKEKMVAVFMETAEVLRVFPEWPREMRLIVCLEPTGECQLLIFRQEETAAFPDRLLKSLDLHRDELCVHPPVKNHPSRQILYTEERGLASLIVDAPEVVERAQDYSMNYSYALEEGMDPIRFIELQDQNDEPEVKQEEPLRFFRRSKMADVTTAPQGSEATQPDPGKEKQAASKLPCAKDVQAPESPRLADAKSKTPMAAAEDPIDFYNVRHEKDGWITIERARPGGLDLLVIDQQQIEWCDATKLFAFPIAPSVQQKPSLPKRVRVYLDVMPAQVVKALRENDGLAGATSDGNFLYLKLSKKPKATVEEIADKRPAEIVVPQQENVPIAASKRPLVAPRRDVPTVGFPALGGQKPRGQVGQVTAVIVLVCAILALGYLQIAGPSLQSATNAKTPPGWMQGGDAIRAGQTG